MVKMCRASVIAWCILVLGCRDSALAQDGKGSVSGADASSKPKTFAVEGGKFVFSFPDAWVLERLPPFDGDLRLKIKPAAGSEFELWISSSPVAVGREADEKSVKKFVLEMGEGLAERTVEGKLELHEVGGGALGYYFVVTDKSFKPEEPGFPRLCQGAVVSNNMIIGFNLLFKDERGDTCKHLIATMRGAKYSKD
jgi:hypothetical protein